MNYLYSYAAKVRPLIDWNVDTKETIEDFEKQWGQGKFYFDSESCFHSKIKVNSLAGLMSTRQ